MEELGLSLEMHLNKALDYIHQAKKKDTDKISIRYNLLMAGAISETVAKEIQNILKVERNGRYV